MNLKIPLTMLVSGAVLFMSCGKKEENVQTQQENKTQTQQQVQPEQNQTQTQQQVQPKQTDTAGTTKKQDTPVKKDQDISKESDKVLDDGTVKEMTANEFIPIWKKKCIKCHGLYGTGKVEGVPDLTSPIIKKKSDKTLFNSISNGIKGETEDDEDMPAFKGKLTDEEIRAAVKYVKSL